MEYLQRECFHSHFRGVPYHVKRELMNHDMEPLKCRHNNFHRSCVTDLLTPLGTVIQDVYDVLITQMKQCNHFTTQNTKPMSRERKKMSHDMKQELVTKLKLSSQIPVASFVIPNVINFVSKQY